MGKYSNIPYSPVDQKLPLFDANLTCRYIHSMFIFLRNAAYSLFPWEIAHFLSDLLPNIGDIPKYLLE